MTNKSGWRQKMKQVLTTIIILVALVIVVPLVWLGYTQTWTGFGAYTAPTGELQRSKTLWDWMELLVVPIALSVLALWFNRQERKAGREAAEKRAETEHEISKDRQREAVLQTYIDKMTELILKEELLKSGAGSEIRSIARVRTLTVLGQLDGKRKGIVLSFLYEANLIDKADPIVDLRQSDFSKTSLYQVDLDGADLGRVNLREADFRMVGLRDAKLPGADLRKASIAFSFLQGANLRHANLAGATIGVSDLTDADMRGTKLRGQDLPSSSLTAGEKREPLVAHIEIAIMKGVKCDSETVWPHDGFDPEEAATIILNDV